MHAAHLPVPPASASAVTIDAVPDGPFRSSKFAPVVGAALLPSTAEAPPEAPARCVAGVALTDQNSVVEGLLCRMIGAGHGVAALSFYLGIGEAEVRQRAAELGLPQPKEKRLRRAASANPWSVEQVRRLIALWLDNAAAGSIAETLGRSSSSIHSKRRWLGLGVRDRKQVARRLVAECARIALPWRPSFDVSGVEARLRSRGAGNPADTPHATPPIAVPEKVAWELGRDREKDERFSVLGFAGLRSERIAERMQIEFGVRLSKKAVDCRISRLQIVRDRRDLIDLYDAEIVEQRASRAKAHFGATLRQCQELHRSFWWCREIGGNRWTCREFNKSKKFRSRKSDRSCGDVMAMAA